MSFRLFPKAPKFFEFFREQNRSSSRPRPCSTPSCWTIGDCDVRCQMINRLEADGDALKPDDFPAALDDLHPRPSTARTFNLINSSRETILNHIQAISKPHRGLRIHPDAVSGTKDGCPT